MNAFSKIGMTPEQVGKFVPAVTDCLEKFGGRGVAGLMAEAVALSGPRAIRLSRLQQEPRRGAGVVALTATDTQFALRRLSGSVPLISTVPVPLPLA